MASKIRKQCVRVWLPLESVPALEGVAADAGVEGGVAGLLAALLEPMADPGNRGLAWVVLAVDPDALAWARDRWGDDAPAMLDDALGRSLDAAREGGH